MSDTAAGIVSVVVLLAALAAVYVPLGDHMARVFTSTRHLRVERALYRVAGVDPDAAQSPRAYLLSVLAFSGMGIIVLMAILILQAQLPLSRGMAGMPFWMAFNTAVSFVTNTNWQSYSGESTLGFTAQMAGLAVQNFLSAAVGLAIAVALVRGFWHRHSGTVGNFWVDLMRGTVRILLPIACMAALVLVAGGVIQNFTDVTMHTLSGHTQVLTGGPVASQEAIKELGNNGGGYFNANSAHPLENPNGFTNLFEIFLMLLVPVCLTRTLGTMLGNHRQGRAILGVMAVLWSGSLVVATWAEAGGHSVAARAAGAAMEGKETRFGEWASALFAVVTTGTSTGAVDSSHDSFTPVGGAAALVNMMLGEVTPGGIGAGLYGILVVAILTVFISGLMVGRTPEFLGKKIGTGEIRWVALYILATPALALVGAGVAIARHQTTTALGNPDGHGFSEVLYAYTSAANNNGSAFAGITVTSDFFQITLAIAMLIGRLLPIAFVVLLAGDLAAQGRIPVTEGTLPTHTPLFVGMLAGVVLIVTGLTYFPALALGPVAEALA